MSIDKAKCILVIGATSGIGRALALALAELPSCPTVIAAGRRRGRLEELADRKIETMQVDMSADRAVLKQVVSSILAKYPELDAVIFSAAIQHGHNFSTDVDLDVIHQEISLNYLAIVSLISMFLPHFLQLSGQGRPSWIIPIGSQLGFMPSPPVINYSASKAALHSFTTSLREQMRGTNVNVLEIIPPLVESELHDEQGTTEAFSKIWMPLDAYTKRTMEGLRNGDAHIPAGHAEEVWKRFQSIDGPFRNIV